MEPKAFNTILFQQESEQWKTDVVFCRDEIKVLNRYLMEVLEKNSSSVRKEEIGQFQYKLTEKMELCYELMGTIMVHDELLRSALPDDTDAEEEHASLKRKVAEFCDSYRALKSLFVRFLAKADFVV